jgi:predicted Zn finger-like uncharacterized protein
MEVRCDRCQTEYDFDEALISMRGTTVKCTECGHAFRVQTNAASEDRWRITSLDGSTRVFTAIGSLQQAILVGDIRPDDMLRRGSAPPRKLGDMAELAQFFTRGQRAQPEPLETPQRHHQPSSHSIPVPDAQTMRPHEASLPESEEFEVRPPRRSVGGGAIALLVALGGVGAGTFWMFKHPRATEAVTVGTTTADIGAPLARVEAAIFASQFELARKELTALPEAHARRLGWRIANHEADGLWLQAQVAESEGERMRLKQELTTHFRSLEGFLQTETTESLARVDSLRLLGRMSEVQPLLASVDRTDPDANYVLGAVDAQATQPPWTTIVDRMRSSAALETKPGRARAFLIYALASSGNAQAARAELERVADQSAPIWRGLRRHIARADAKAEEAFDAGSAGPSPDDAGALARGVADPRLLTAEGAKALARGEFDHARRSFQAALDRNPNDSEALAGLADVERARKNSRQALLLYRRALAVNPTFLPALIAAADVEWDLGERSAAERSYSDIVNRFPESSYPARVKERSTRERAPDPEPTTTTNAVTTTSPASAATNAPASGSVAPIQETPAPAKTSTQVPSTSVDP